MEWEEYSVGRKNLKGKSIKYHAEENRQPALQERWLHIWSSWHYWRWKPASSARDSRCCRGRRAHNSRGMPASSSTNAEETFTLDHSPVIEEEAAGARKRAFRCQTKMMMPINHFLNEKPKEQEYRLAWHGNKSYFTKLRQTKDRLEVCASYKEYWPHDKWRRTLFFSFLI